MSEPAISPAAVLGFLRARGGEVRSAELVSEFRARLEGGGGAAARRELFEAAVNAVAVVKERGGTRVVVLRRELRAAPPPGGAVEPTGNDTSTAPPPGGAVEPMGNDTSTAPPHGGAVEPVANAEGTSTALQPGSTTETVGNNTSPVLLSGGAVETVGGGPSTAVSPSVGRLPSPVPSQEPPSPRAVSELRGLFQGSGAGGVPMPGNSAGARREPPPKPCMLPVRCVPAPAAPALGEPTASLSPPEQGAGSFLPPPASPLSPPRQGASSPLSAPKEESWSSLSPQKEKTGSPLSLPKEGTRSPLSPHNEGTRSPLSTPEEGTRSLLSPPEEEIGSRSPGPRQALRSHRASEEPSAVPLEEAEHRWLVLAAGGQWTQQLHGLLLGDSSLAARRDFISGFTALHWAAKSGNCDMLTNIIRAAEKAGTHVNVDARSHGGYTALHLAAIHGQEKIITMLVYSYRANTDLRDYSGKKPHQYLKEGASSAVRRLLGDPSLAHNTEPSAPIKKSTKLAASILSSTSTFLGVISDDMAFYDLTKGLRKPSSLNKLLAATTGPRRKPKTRRGFPSYSSLSEVMEEEEEEIIMKRRPVSELFFGH